MRAVMQVLFFNIILLSSSVFISCGEGEGGRESNIEIKLEDEMGKSISNITVYKYTALAWKAGGDTGLPASREAVSDSFGIVKFTILSSEFLNPTETFYFSCNYNINKTARVEVSLKEGEDVTKILKLK